MITSSETTTSREVDIMFFNTEVFEVSDADRSRK
jgi:hypothetical protein